MGSKGVSKYDNIFKVNQIYGKWLILNEKILIDGEAKVLCRCLECSQTEKYVPAYQLVTGVSKRCSVCGYSLKEENNPAWKGYGKVPGEKLSKIERGARLRNIDFNLTIEFISELYDKQNGKCFYTGLPITFKDKTSSLERIDSKIGYEEFNVVWVHKNVNIMKRDLSYDEFYNVCKLVVENKKENI
jgi:hypothetical protein